MSTPSHIANLMSMYCVRVGNSCILLHPPGNRCSKCLRGFICSGFRPLLETGLIWPSVSDIPSIVSFCPFALVCTIDSPGKNFPIGLLEVRTRILYMYRNKLRWHTNVDVVCYYLLCLAPPPRHV